MTAAGVTVVQLIAPTREQQLERELADCYAALELKQAQLEDASAKLEAAGPSVPSGNQEVIVVGGGFVAEADGWLWLVWRGTLTRLGRASEEDVELADAVRSRAATARAERMRHAS